MHWNQILAVVFVAIQLLFIARAILRPQREPASRVAWIVVIMLLPGLGVLAYILLGETSIGRHRIARLHQVNQVLQQAQATQWPQQIPERFSQLFRFGQSVNGFVPVAGNSARLLADSDAAIDAIVADIDAATEHVHLIFYIWLTDHSGLKVVAALQRAAARKVACRAMADGLGSRLMIASPHWQAMQDAGVQVAVALPIGNPLLRPLRGRIDLRNHRKIVVIDRHITYCGSQNCADAAFLVKAKFAPWVDIMLRLTGPIAQQNQLLFMSDWMAQTHEDLSRYAQYTPQANEDGFVAQVIGTGPTLQYSAMPEVFVTLMFAAQRELFITTPYFVPDEAMQAALCATARRGVKTTIIFPARNDSWIVAAASHSYYGELLAAGVEIYEYVGGVLHAKTLTLDGEVSLIGSANMDRRSFELNFENNILLYDAAISQDIRQRQAHYLAQSQPVTAAMVEQWPMRRRFWNNTIAMLGPVL
ncbi:cardiolipin synthase [Deefgea piscis]|uniref:cardiolipin synthase n=1 Tax=Deefgea piscis TaxID=2739061 RepID=UPI001C7F2F2E|nr:cardiolipin synthase [Deefgea piscis]QZA81382.1 cardiolipin synthase [Deefgea piscis]